MRIHTFIAARLGALRNARKTRAEIEALQLRKFRRLVAHAARNAPYFRDLIASRQIDIATCVPSDFPPLTKIEMMESFDRIVTDPAVTRAGVEQFVSEARGPAKRYLGKYLVMRTFGTSGLVAYSVLSPADWARGAALGMRVWPVSLSRRKMAFYGLVGGHYGGASHMSESTSGLARLRFDTRSFDIRKPIGESIEGLNRFMPETLSGYPSSLLMLAEAQQAGDLRIAPRYIAVGGEALTPGDRAILNETFGADILNVYGATELLTMGVGRPEDNGIVLFDDEFIFEIEDNRVLVTSLHNFTQPLIRYVLDDRLVPLAAADPAFPFTRVHDIGGRASADAVFSRSDGSKATIPTDQIATYLTPIADISRVQLHISDRRACVLQMRLRSDLATEEREAVLQSGAESLDRLLTDHRLADIKRSIEEVESFAPGKATLVVNHATQP